MATEFHGLFTPGKGLGAASAADAEAMDGLKPAKVYRVVCTEVRGRSIQQHRLLFGLMKIIRENSPIEPPMSNKTVLNALKIKTGHVEVAALPSGEIIMFPSSIAFANMPQEDFNPWFERAVDVMCREFVPGLSTVTAKAEIYAIAEGKRAA